MRKRILTQLPQMRACVSRIGAADSEKKALLSKWLA